MCDSILLQGVGIGLNNAKYGAATKSIRGSKHRVHTVMTPTHMEDFRRNTFYLIDLEGTNFNRQQNSSIMK